MKLRSLIFAAGLTAVLQLSGCGGGGGAAPVAQAGGGYSGSTEQATVSEDNAESVSRSSVEGAKEATRQDSAFTGRAVAAKASEADRLAAIDLAVIAQTDAQLSRATRSTVSGDCGGTASQTQTGANSGTIRYTNFCVSSGEEELIVNGVVSYTVSDTAYHAVYQNFSMTLGGTTETVNMTVDCTIEGGMLGSCQYSSDFTGSDGRVYRTAHVSVSGSEYSGYTISARLYDPTHGYVDISGTGITFCEAGGIGSGSLRITDSTKAAVLELSFPSCTQMTMTYDGVATTLEQ